VGAAGEGGLKVRKTRTFLFEHSLGVARSAIGVYPPRDTVVQFKLGPAPSNWQTLGGTLCDPSAS
jgi:hypothetical protein